MKVYELLFESDESISHLFKSIVDSYVNTLRTITQNIRDDGTHIGKIKSRLSKANWISNNYLSSQKYKQTGIQRVAVSMFKYAKSPEAKQLLQELSNLKYLALKESGKGKLFDKVGDILSSYATFEKDIDTKRKLNNLIRARDDYTLALKEQEVKKRKEAVKHKPKPQKNSLMGQQNAQAEQMFQQLIKSLPKSIQQQIRQETQRMTPTEKMKYLKQIR